MIQSCNELKNVLNNAWTYMAKKGLNPNELNHEQVAKLMALYQQYYNTVSGMSGMSDSDIKNQFINMLENIASSNGINRASMEYFINNNLKKGINSLPRTKSDYISTEDLYVYKNMLGLFINYLNISGLFVQVNLDGNIAAVTSNLPRNTKIGHVVDKAFRDTFELLKQQGIKSKLLNTFDSKLTACKRAGHNEDHGDGCSYSKIVWVYDE